MVRLLGWRFLQYRPESVHDYAGVLVPLEEAHLHSHSARSGRTEFEERRDVEDEGADPLMQGDDEADKDRESGEGTGMLQMSAAEYTIEGLRREMRQGERGRVWTEYECKFATKKGHSLRWWHACVANYHAKGLARENGR